MTKLTYQQKLDALSYRFYQGGAWTPKAGDFYTTSRADLELYQVVSVEGGVVRTRFTEGSDAISEWPEAGFLTEGFGPRRVFVPEWVICAPAAPPQTNADGTAEIFEAMWKNHRDELLARVAELEAELASRTAAPENQMTGPIEEAPAEGFFLAETRDGDWIKAERYDNPFGDKNTVISRRTGKWWSPTRWMPLPATTEGQNNG